jgi:hypothetical protein
MLGQYRYLARVVWMVFCLAAEQQTARETDTPIVPTFGTTVIDTAGLHGEIYFLSEGTEFLPRFKHRDSIGSIYTTRLDIPPRDFREGFPGISKRVEWFAVDYTGRFWLQQKGVYRFGLTSDDGSKLYLDRRLVIDNDGLHPSSICTAVVELAYGLHSIRVSYFQGPGYQVSLILNVAKPGEGWKIFDTRDFLPVSQSMGGIKFTSRPSKNRLERKISGGSCWGGRS